MKLFKLLLLMMLVASIVPTVMVGWTSISGSRELLMGDAQELARERVKQLRLKTEAILDEPGRTVTGIGRIPGFFSLPLAEQRSHLAAVLNQRREIAVLTLFSADGQRISGLQALAVQEIPLIEVAQHEARAAALLPGLSGVRYSEVTQSPSRSQAVVTLAFAIGEPVEGYGAAEISLGELRRMLWTARLGSPGLAYLVDDRGRLVAGTGLGELKVGSDATARPAVAHLLQNRRAAPRAEIFHVGDFGEGPEGVVAAYTVLPEVGWAVLSEQPVELAYRQVGTMRRQIALGVATAILVALGLAAVFSGTLTRPLGKFAKAALEIAKGRFGVQVNYSAKNELGDLARTFNYMSAQIDAYVQETQRLYESLEGGYLQTIVALANSIDSKDAYTRGHSQRVGDLAVELGRELGLTERELKHLRYGGILHDIGKIGIVDSILCKQTALTEQEMLVMRDHPVIGDGIIEPVSFLSGVRSAVRHHHERWDGKGYPDGLAGEQIPLVARIVGCADTFDACTSTRPYQAALGLEPAMRIMAELRGTSLDPAVVDALERLVQSRGLTLAGGHVSVKLAS